MGVVEVEDVRIGVVSIHLDPFKSHVRMKQLESLYSTLEPLDIPLIVMGDFNLEWSVELEAICSRLGLQPYAPTQSLVSFPKLNQRLDWILIDDSLGFQTYHTESTTLSDHNLIVSTIRLDTE